MSAKVEIPLIINDDGSVTLGKIADGLDKVGKKAKQTQSIFGEFGSKMTAGLGIGAGFSLGAAAADKLLGAMSSIPAEFSRIVEEGGKLADLAAKTGLTTTSLQELSYAGSLVGVGLETATGAVTRMQKALVDTPDKFHALGLSAQELINMDPGQAFGAIAEEIGAIPNPAERAAAAMRLFGKSGAELLPLIASMREAKVEAELLGTTIGEESIAKLDSMGDANTRAAASWDAVKTRLVATTVAVLDLDSAMNGLAVATGKVGKIIDKLTGGDAGVGLGASIKKTLLNGALVGGPGAMILAGLKGLSTEMDDEKAKAKASASSFAAEIFKPFDAMPGPQGGAAFDMLGDQLRKSQAETAKTTKEHERLTEATKKEAEAFAKLGASIQASMTFRPDVAGDWGRDTFSSLVGSGDQGPIETLLVGDKSKFSDLLPGAKQVKVEIDGSKQSTIDWSNALDRVSNQFAQLASGGGPLSGMLGMLANAGQLTAGIGSGIKDFNAGKAAGGFGGFLQQASGVIGIASAAFGFIGGLFGKGKRKREEEKKRKEQLLKDSEDQLKGLVDEWDKARREFVDRGASGVGAMFQSIADGASGSAERMARLGRMGGTALSLLRKEGLSFVEAMRQMGPTIESAIAAAQKSGHKLTGPMAELADLKTKTDKNPKTVAAADGFNDYIAMLRSQGMLTTEAMADITAELADQMADLGKAGFTTSQQLMIMAPSLYQLQQAQKAGQIQLDATTQAMVDQAEAANLFDGMQDPMAALVEIQQQMLLVTAALAEAFGVTLPASVQKYIDEVNQIPTIPMPPGSAPTPGTTPAPSTGSAKHPEFAEGGSVPFTGLAMLHGTPSKPEHVFTHDQMTRIFNSRGGGIGGGQQRGATTIHIGSIVSRASDPKAVADAVVKQIEGRANSRLRTAIREAGR